MAVSRAKLRRLEKYLEGDSPNSAGEWGMHCPFHHDTNRSASLNIETELWYCNTCDIGGAVDELVQRVDAGEATVAYWSDDFKPRAKGSRNGHGAQALPSEAQVRGWHSGLLGRKEELNALMSRRGFTLETIKRWLIGWDPDQDAYTIPVRSVNGEIVNVRFYQLDPGDDRRKIWSVAGHGEPTLYPVSQLDGNREIIICEGEWDALLTIQKGFAAITRTGAAKVWKDSWNPLFEDKVVYICHDMDEPGQAGNSLVQGRLQNYAAETHVVKLPFRVVPKHGKDLTDYWLRGFDPEDFKNLLNDSEVVLRDPELVEDELVELPVTGSFDAAMSKRKIRMRATVVGKRRSTYLLPMDIDYSCTMDAGPQCDQCPMKGYGGVATRHVGDHDPVILEMMGADKKQLNGLVRDVVKAQPCKKLEWESVEDRSVSVLYVRNAMEHGRDDDHATRDIVCVGNTDAEANRTVEVVGKVFPHPKTQINTFQAWEIAPTTTSFEEFELNDDAVAQMLRFQAEPGEVYDKLNDIAEQLAAGVTKIRERRRMHVLMDLVWHSVLTFTFLNEPQKKGWLEALIVGDTRTGKSEAASKLVDWYQAGEMVNCESASYAGIMGGLQQMADKEWAVTWGAIPLNDRRLVVLDEISGLEVQQIQDLSQLRSSGEAQITKIEQAKTWARTRLLWMGNPRKSEAGMDDFTYGIYAIPPLIGQPEDIARFDIAMSLRSDDVDSAVINSPHHGQNVRYTQKACQTLLRWVWSRRQDQIKWAPGAENLVLEAANELGNQFIQDPPLIQGSSVRFKVARLAAAIAARTFSTDRTHEIVYVRCDHVEAAKGMILALYGEEGFGYLRVSQEVKNKMRQAASQSDESKQWLYEREGLLDFLIGKRDGHFRRHDLEDMLNMDKEQSSSVVAQMVVFGLVRKDGANIKYQPMLHSLLRDLHGMERKKN